MSEYQKALKDRYASVADDELRHIATTSDLTSEARDILAQELRKRGIVDLDDYKEQIQHEEKQRREHLNHVLNKKEKASRFYARLGYGICLLAILSGLTRMFIEGNERDGVGMITAGVVVLPIVWGGSLLRRLWWRFVLRP